MRRREDGERERGTSKSTGRSERRNWQCILDGFIRHIVSSGSYMRLSIIAPSSEIRLRIIKKKPRKMQLLDGT